MEIYHTMYCRCTSSTTVVTEVGLGDIKILNRKSINNIEMIPENPISSEQCLKEAQDMKSINYLRGKCLE